MTTNSSSNRGTAGWPKLRFNSAPGLRAYTVCVQRRPRAALVVLGEVQQFGSLPSCRRWKAHAEGGAWTRSRQTRADAAADLWAATCVFCVERPGGQVDHLLTLGEVGQDATFVVRCAEHPHEPVRPAVADFSAPVEIDY